MKYNYMYPSMKATILLFMLLLTLTYFVPQENNLMLEYKFIKMSATEIYIPIIIDKTSLIFSMTVTLISMSVMMFSSSYMKDDKNMNYFIWIVLIFVFSMNLLIFLPNLITLILGWDGLGLSSYLLVIYYLNNKSLGAGMLTALTNRIGDALLILAIALAFNSSHWNFMNTQMYSNFLLVILMIMTALTKSAQMPFSAWLPAAMAAPTPVSALVHSSTLVTAGIYLIIRFYPTLSEFWQTNFICFYLGTMTCLMASTSASSENDLKKIIALSTLSQLGIMMMALGLSQPLIAFFHLITHALFKALLFICAGTMIHLETNNQDIRLMGNVNSYSTLYIVFLNVANLSLCATPFLAGFYSKDSIVETFFFSSTPISTSFMMIMSMCMTTLYTVRLSFMTLWSPKKVVNSHQFCSKFTYLPALILMMGAIMGGSFMSHYMMPMITSPTLPKMLKLMAFSVSITFAALMTLTFKMKLPKNTTYFLNSMWYQTLISSTLTSKSVMKMSSQMYLNEILFMETISGKGTNFGIDMSEFKINQNDTFLAKLSKILTLLGIVILGATIITVLIELIKFLTS